MTALATNAKPSTASAAALIEDKPAAAASTAGADFNSIDDCTPEQLAAILELASQIKADFATGKPGKWATALAGKSVVMLFEKPSLRTRVSFEIGINKLGGHAMYFDHDKQKIGEREPIVDYAKNLERFADAIVARTFSHDTLTGLAEHGSIPVVNALSDHEHPCQALADLLTLKEQFGTLQGLKLAWLGDGNNVCHSLMLACAKLGVSMTVVTPKGFEPQFHVLKSALDAAKLTGATITLSNRVEAVEGHHAVYTDCWVSMGQDHQAQLRNEAFAGFCVDEDMMDLIGKNVDADPIFMHCLPAYRGKEVEAEVIDGPASVVYDQAENRMWAQNALLVTLLAPALAPQLASNDLNASPID
ncbi:MAG: ornithine carbamoyltransferase [Planctomycetota bacterium]